MHRSATPWWWTEKLYSQAIFLIVDIGIASLGSAGGLSSPNFLSRRAIGRLSACCAEEERRGSQCPSSIQNVLLGNGMESFLNRLNLEPTPKAVLAFLHGNSKGEKHVFDVTRGERRSTAVERIQAAMRLPRTPVPLPFGPIHSCRSNCFPRNVSKMLNFTHSGTSVMLHVCCSGSGKATLNEETKSWSDRTGVVARKKVNAFDGREAISAMMFSGPGT